VAGVLFPDEPAECQRVIETTAWALPFMGFELMIAAALNALGREAVQARLSMLAATSGLLVGGLLIGRWNMAGACWFMLCRPAIFVAFVLPEFARTLMGLAHPISRAARVLSLSGICERRRVDLGRQLVGVSYGERA
jgi:O-antigen/teichoic acid export membrane protein